MTKKNNSSSQKAKPQRSQKSNNPPSKKATPFADTGAIVGDKLGSMFNAPALKGVGRWLGSGIGSIFGSGDYTLAGSPPAYNVLQNGGQIPKFSSTHQTNIVCHREYLGDITGTTAFTNLAYPLNPGMAQTFPWLSSVAQNYQQYKFHGLVFEFRSLITDFVTSGAPGVVVMATNYNADQAAYSTKQEMENTEFAVAVKPTLNLMHAVECAVDLTSTPIKYVREGTVPSAQDLRLYDQGKFQFATQANPTQTLGELWVSYCVEFFKPELPNDTGGNAYSAHLYRTGVDATHQLGATASLLSGNLNVTAQTATSFTFDTFVGNRYLVSINWTSNTPGLVVVPTIALTSTTPLQIFVNDSTSQISTPFGVGATSSDMSVVIAFIAGASSTTLSLTGGTFFGTTNVDVVATQISSIVTA